MISSILSWTETTKDTGYNWLVQFQNFSLLQTRMSSLNLVGSLAVVKMITIVKPLKAIDILSKKRIWIILVTCSAVTLSVSLAALREQVVYSHLFKDSYFTKRDILEEIIAAEIWTSLFFLLSVMA